MRPDSRYSVLQAANILQVSRSTIYNATISGNLSFALARNGRKVITGKEIVAFWAANY